MMEAVKEKVELQRYSEYKDSEVEYLGDIPTDWETAYLGSIVEPKSDKGHPNFDVLSVYRDYGVIPKDSRDDNHNATSLDTTNYKAVEPGDLVVNKMKAWQGSMGISNYKGIVSPAYITCKVRNGKFDGKYLHYLLRSQSYIGEYNRLSYGVRIGQWDMHYEDFKKVTVVIPSPEEQTAIVNFLDRKTEQIDQAIEIKQKQIELLKERRQILIHKAVTRGLNPEAPIKPSGVDWIGDIPEHWEVLKVRRITKEHKQGYYTTESYVDEGIKLLRITDFRKNGLLDISECPKVRENKDALNYLLNPGDIVFARTGGAGNFAVFPDIKEPVVFASYLIRFRFDLDKVMDGFLKYYFLSEAFKKGIHRNIHGGVNQNIHAEDIKDQVIAFPSLKEQMNIVENLDQINDHTEKAIDQLNDEIDKMYEYKTTLINSAVTGKIKVV